MCCVFLFVDDNRVSRIAAAVETTAHIKAFLAQLIDKFAFAFVAKLSAENESHFSINIIFFEAVRANICDVLR